MKKYKFCLDEECKKVVSIKDSQIYDYLDRFLWMS